MVAAGVRCHVSLQVPTHHPRQGRAPVIPAGDAGVRLESAQDVATLGGWLQLVADLRGQAVAFALHILGHAAVAKGKMGVRRDADWLPQGAVDQVVYLANDRLGFIMVRPTSLIAGWANRCVGPFKTAGYGPVNRSVWTLTGLLGNPGSTLADRGRAAQTRAVEPHSAYSRL